MSSTIDTISITSPSGESILIEEYRKAQARFYKMLDDCKLYYYKENGILARPGYGYYTPRISVLLSVNAVTDTGIKLTKIYLVFSPQTSFHKNTKSKKGYILANLNSLHSSFSMREAMNSIFCTYCIDEDKFLFKPVIWLLRYYEVLSPVARSNRDKKPYAKYQFIRVEPKAKPPDPRHPGSGALQPWQAYTPPGPPYHFFFENRTDGITHKEKMLFTEAEFTKFLNEHNSYPDMMKLKFRLAMNLLTEGELIL